MILCVSAPAAAETIVNDRQLGALSVGMQSDMPCCPEKAPNINKACGLQCPVIVTCSYEFEIAIKAESMTFSAKSDLYAGIISGPLSPPPR